MIEEKKSFFEILDAKSAMLVGVVGGLLTLGTIGFVVLGILVLKGNIKITKSTDTAVAAIAQNNQPSVPAQAGGQAPAPAVPKADRPKVELFVMSYCPYGLQMEKAYVPAWQLLKNRADIDVKFVSYAMHGQKEVEENTRQYCIEKDQSDKYAAYLKCFTTSGDYQSCLTQSGVDAEKLSSCSSKTDKQFGITAKFNDQSSWLSGRYPIYPIYSDLNQKYGVQGSPTLVINGAQADVGRTPEAVKQAICASFTNPPAECGQTLDSSQFQPGFGAATAAASGGQATPGCGA